MLFALSCEPLTLNFKNGESRFFHEAPRALSFVRDGGAVSAIESYYYTTVSFPEDYDWRRDTSYGAVKAVISLYRNDSILLQIPTGSLASPDADMHHFVQGHLYTQFRSGGRTLLAKDGEPMLELGYEAILAGLLPLGGRIYTLWEHRGGEGFTLLEGDSELFSRSKGKPAGSLSISAYAPYGALYPDMGKPCFSYRNGDDWFVVSGTQESVVRKPSGTIYDLRCTDGQVCLFYRDNSGTKACFHYKQVLINYPLSQQQLSGIGYIYSENGNPYCVGIAYNTGNTATASCLVGFVSGLSVTLPGSYICPLSSNPAVLLFFSPDGTAGYYSMSSGIRYLEGRFYHLSPYSGITLNGSKYIALNPMEQGRKPCIWKDGEIQELDFNGFISGIYQSSQ